MPRSLPTYNSSAALPAPEVHGPTESASSPTDCRSAAQPVPPTTNADVPLLCCRCPTKCARCGKRSHWARECKNEPDEPYWEEGFWVTLWDTNLGQMVVRSFHLQCYQVHYETQIARLRSEPIGQSTHDPPLLPLTISSNAEQPANPSLQTVEGDTPQNAGGEKKMSSEVQHVLEKEILEEANRLKTLGAKTATGPRDEPSASAALDEAGKPVNQQAVVLHGLPLRLRCLYYQDPYITMYASKCSQNLLNALKVRADYEGMLRGAIGGS